MYGCVSWPGPDLARNDEGVDVGYEDRACATTLDPLRQKIRKTYDWATEDLLKADQSCQSPGNGIFKLQTGTAIWVTAELLQCRQAVLVIGQHLFLHGHAALSRGFCRSWEPKYVLDSSALEVERVKRLLLLSKATMAS